MNVYILFTMMNQLQALAYCSGVFRLNFHWHIFCRRMITRDSLMYIPSSIKTNVVYFSYTRYSLLN